MRKNVNCRSSDRLDGSLTGSYSECLDNNMGFQYGNVLLRKPPTGKFYYKSSNLGRSESHNHFRAEFGKKQVIKTNYKTTTKIETKITERVPKLNNRLNGVYFNARSVVNKLDALELYIKEENFDIVGITETWLTQSIASSELNIEGYTLFRNDRNNPNKTRGGGVALYVRN